MAAEGLERLPVQAVSSRSLYGERPQASLCRERNHFWLLLPAQSLGEARRRPVVSRRGRGSPGGSRRFIAGGKPRLLPQGVPAMHRTRDTWPGALAPGWMVYGNVSPASGGALKRIWRSGVAPHLIFDSRPSTVCPPSREVPIASLRGPLVTAAASSDVPKSPVWGFRRTACGLPWPQERGGRGPARCLRVV